MVSEQHLISKVISIHPHETGSEIKPHIDERRINAKKAEYNSAAKDKVMRDIIPRNEHTKGSEKSAAFFAASDAGEKKKKPKNSVKICVCQKF